MLNAYETFCQKIADCALQQQFSLEIIETQRQKILSDYSTEIMAGQFDTPIYKTNLTFYSWDGRIVNYGNHDATIRTQWDDTVFYHNKIYQWLLVIAFEAYEEYLWILNGLYSFGAESKSAKDILWKIRSRFPEYHNFEKRVYAEVNKDLLKASLSPELQKQLLSDKNYQTNFKKSTTDRIDSVFQLALIEAMRHKIVHGNGNAKDRERFVEEILKPIGLYNAGHYKEYFKDQIDSFFTLSHPDEIALLEIPVLELLRVRARTDILDGLLQVLLNSAYHIRKCIESKTN